MKHRPWSVTVTFGLILVNTLIWLVQGIIISLGAYPTMSVPTDLKAVLAGMSFGMAAILLTIFIFLVRRNRKAYYFGLAFFAVTALLTIFDQAGLADLVVLVLNLVPIILLVLNRKWYLGYQAEEQSSSQAPEP